MWVALLTKYGQDFDYFLSQIFWPGFFAFKEEEKADEIADKMACLELASQGARGDSVDQM